MASKEAAMAKTEKIATQQYVIIAANPNNNAIDVAQHLGNALQKNRLTHFAYFASQQQINQLQNTKVFQTHSKQIACFQHFNQLQAWVQSANNQKIVFTNDVNLSNVSTALHLCDQVTINHQQMLNCVPASNKKTGRIPFKNRIINFTRQLFSGYPSNDENNLFLIINANNWLQLSQSVFFQKLFPQNLIHQTEKAAHCSGFQVIQQSEIFNKINGSTHKTLGKIGHEITQGLKNRIAFMVGQSIAEVKQGRGWQNGNAGGYRLLFMAFSVLLLFLMPILSLGFGITWDEINIIVYAEDILNYYFSFGEETNVLNKEGGRDYNVLVNYGLFFDSFAALINKFSPFSIYQTRHILNALVGFAGIFFTGLLAREAGSWRTGLLGLLFLALSPYFFGHAMNNPKDIPFASGFIMSIYFIIRFLKQLPKPKTSTIFLLILSIAFVNSIRIGGLMLIGFLGLFTGLAWIKQSSKLGLGKALLLIPGYAKNIVAITLSSFFLALLVWPYGLQNPIQNPFEALQFFTNFSGVTIYEIFEGKRIYMNEVPWYYIPKFLLIGNPLFAVFGLFLALLPMLLTKKSKLNTAVIWATSFTLVFPIAYAVYGNSTLYNGWRHFIFVYPAMVVLAAAGWDFLLQLSNNKIAKYAISAVVGVLMLNTTYWMVKYHPNQYVYYNELVGGYAGAYGNYELDTYGNGIRQAFEKLVELYPETQTKNTLVALNMTGWDWEHESTKDYFGDSVKGAWTREYERFKKPFDYAIFFPRTYSPHELKIGAYPPKGTVYVEEIEGKPLYAIVKRENDYMVEGHKAFDKNRHTKAIQNFELALQYDSLNEEAWRNVGLSYLNSGQPDKALNALNKAVEINPNSHIAQSYLAVYYQRQNNLQKAADYYKMAIENKINYSFPYIQLGNIYMASNMFADALNYYENGLQRVGRLDPQILTSMGTCYLQLRDYNNAINYLSTAINQDPNYGDAYYNLGVTYSQMGDELNAQKYLQLAQQLRGR